MRVTIARRLSFGVGLFVAMLAITGGFSLWQTERIALALARITDNYEPVSEAGYEMEINLIGTGFAALAYVDSRDPWQRARIVEDADEFAHFEQRYRERVSSDRMRALAARISAGYQRFSGLAERLTDQVDAEEALRANFRDQLDSLEHTLELRIEAEVDALASPADLAERVRPLLHMEEFIVQLAIHPPVDDFARMESTVHGFARSVADYRLRVPALEGWTAALEHQFSQTARLAGELHRRRSDRANDLAALLDLRESLDALLDDQLQAQSREHLLQAQADARRLSRQTVAGLALVVPLVLAIGLGGGWLTARRILGPLRQLMSATREVASGKLESHLEIDTGDEFGTLGTAFNHMTGELQRNLVARSYLESVLEAMSEALLVIRADGTIRRVNVAACQWLGYTEPELV